MTVTGVLTRYLLGIRILLEQDKLGDQTAWNVYGTNLISREVGTVTLIYMYNGHADVTALLDTNGNVVATYYYDAFGNILEKTGTADNSILFGGYQYDEETGLYYLNSRMYDPITARFLQEDTYKGNYNDPLSLNLYVYCHNEPIMYIDPSGNVYVNMTINGKTIKNTVEVNGTAYGNIFEMAKAMGYEVRQETTNKKIIIFYFDNNNIKRSTTYSANSPNSLVSIKDLAQRTGYSDTLSWWHDSKGILNTDLRTGIKYAPIKVIRQEDNVKIKAYVDLKGDTNLKPSFWRNNAKNNTYAELAI